MTTPLEGAMEIVGTSYNLCQILKFCLKVIALGDEAKTTKIQNMLPVFTNGLMA